MMRRALLAGMSVLMVLASCEDEPAGPNDVSPPGRVTAIAVTGAGADNLLLEWIAPGDDGGYGTATSYEIRRSSDFITEANFAYATVVANPPAPVLPGTIQQFVIAGIDTTRETHVALRATDEVGNVSRVSADAGWRVRFAKGIAAVRDNTMYEESPDSSNGKGRHLFCGTSTAETPAARRALVAFPIGENVPAGAIVDSVSLTLHVSGPPTGGATAVSLHRVIANWGEGASNATGEEETGARAQSSDATWTYRFYNTSLWASEGGDYDATGSAQVSTAGAGFYTWTSPRMRSDLQGWLATPSQNFGWILVGDETVAGTVRRFDSRENPTSDNHPRLRVFYTIRSLTTTKVSP